MNRVLTVVVRTLCVVVVLVACACDRAWAVAGDAWGEWTSGSTVLLDGPVRVPPGKTLVIEGGVRILVKTTAAFEVLGQLRAEGTAADPVVVVPLAEWEGFRFRNSSECWNSLHYVVFSAESGAAFRAVTSDNSNLEVADCDFWARMSCLYVSGGRLRAENNRFLTVGLWSETVHVSGLKNDVENPCDDPEGNAICRNVIRAVVPYCDTCQQHGQQPFLTVGLRVSGSTNTCLSDNATTVEAPLNSVGVFIGPGVSSGQASHTLSGCLVTVRSLQGWARGIVADCAVLDVVQCTIDVAGGVLSWLPEGVNAAGANGLHAVVFVNSSVVQLDRGEVFFHSHGGSEIYVDFVTEWSSGGALGLVQPPIAPPTRTVDDEGQVIRHASVRRIDPELSMSGEWGTWRTLAEVREYYSLLPSSPCIDEGDTRLPLDPDASRADIGCYYYPHAASADDPNPLVLPACAALLPPYPNPFNSTAVIPFSVSRSGRVKIVLFDLLGREAAVLTSGVRSPGSFSVPFAGADRASGLYLVALEFEGHRVQVVPLILTK